MSVTLFSSRRKAAPRWPGQLPAIAVLIVFSLSYNAISVAQTPKPGNSPGTDAKSATDQKPLTSDERAELMKLIQQLQERVAKLEAAQAAPSQSPAPNPSPAAAEAKYDPSTSDDPHVWMEPVV